MPVQPVDGRARPSKAVWETRCTGWDGPGRTACAFSMPPAGCTGTRAAGSSFARRCWGPSGVVPDPSATGLQGPLDSRRR